MSDYSGIVAAVDRLTEVLSQSQPTLFSNLAGAFIATIRSIISVLLFEIIKDYALEPRKEFKKLRRKVNSSLKRYACYYMNEIDCAHSDTEKIMVYKDAANSIRNLSVDLAAFADDMRRESCCGVSRAEISDAASSLMGLSNSFFTPYNRPDSTICGHNGERRDEIKFLLKIK